MNPATFAPTHFLWEFADGVATITLNRPERKNPLTFESYAELRDTFRNLVYAMPPYICSDDEIAAICTAMRAVAEAHPPA